MTPAEISSVFGASEVFSFTYDDVALAQAFTFSAGDWGLYTADNVEVSDTITPSLDEDGVTSLAGSWTASITLFHLDTFSSAHVVWEGTDVAVEYTLDGTAWTELDQHDVVDLSGDPDFDIRVSFAGGIEDDPAELVSLTVYVLETDTIISQAGTRTISFSADKITDDGLVTDAVVTLNASTDDPEPVVGTIEIWAETQGSSTILSSPPSGTSYKNGAAGASSAGELQHYVLVLTTPANPDFTIAADVTVSHVALYEGQLTSTEIANLYASQNPAPLTIDDDSSFTVAETEEPLDVYAYSWSIVSGGPA